MKKLLLVLGLLVYGLGFSQNVQISGSVLDGEINDEPLAFVKIGIKGSNQIAESDKFGNYVLHIDPGTYTIIYEFIGYKPFELKHVIVKNKNISLREIILNAKEITFENDIASKG